MAQQQCGFVPLRTFNMALVGCLTIIGGALGTEPKNEPAKETREERQKRVTEIKRDLTADQVHRILGKPDRVARQLHFRKHIEQWVYDFANPVRIEFICIPGEEARVLTVYPRLDGFSN